MSPAKVARAEAVAPERDRRPSGPARLPGTARRPRRDGGAARGGAPAPAGADGLVRAGAGAGRRRLAGRRLHRRPDAPRLQPGPLAGPERGRRPGPRRRRGRRRTRARPPAPRPAPTTPSTPPSAAPPPACARSSASRPPWPICRSRQATEPVETPAATQPAPQRCRAGRLPAARLRVGTAVRPTASENHPRGSCAPGRRGRARARYPTPGHEFRRDESWAGHVPPDSPRRPPLTRSFARNKSATRANPSLVPWISSAQSPMSPARR